MSTVDGFYCFGLELPWLDNQSSISCIPEGVYQCRKTHSNKNKYCIEIMNVTGRTNIQIHAGNYTRNIQGCVLVGDSIAMIDLDSIPDVSNSKLTLSKLMSHLPDSFELEIQ